MNDAKCELTQDWLTKARQDILSAEKLVSGADPLFGVALYHCQQAVEKALKGLLVFKDRRFGKTHDLRTLLNLALSSEFEVGFAQAERAYALVLELVPPSARP